MKPTDFVPPPTETLELPLDALALKLLAFLRAIEDSGGVASPNFVTNAAHWAEYEPMDQSREPFMRALREAWDWLYLHGLVGAPEREERSFVTRRGRALLSEDDGLARLSAQRRLDVDLHSLIADRILLAVVARRVRGGGVLGNAGGGDSRA
jgi:hypothetical protein